MSNHKRNKSLWQMQGLLVLMCILLLVLATGTAQARYRAERNVGIEFQVKEQAQIYLGTLSKRTVEPEEETEEEPVEETYFDPKGIPTWITDDGIHSMEFFVANGSSEEDFSEEDQQFRLELVGSLGLGTEEAFPKITLWVPSEENPETYEAFQATASRIKEGSMQYYSVGSGWIIRFQNEEGQEPMWILRGGSQSYKRFIITLENVQTDTDILLQPQVAASVIQK